MSHLKTLALISLILGIAVAVLFYHQNPGLNFFLFIVLLICGSLLLSRLFSRSLEKSSYALILLALYFAAMVFVRASEMLTFFNIIGTFLLLLLVVNSFAGKKIRSYLLCDYAKIFALPLYFVSPFFETLPEIFSSKKLLADHPRKKEIIRGTVMAVVAVVIFAWLFSSADAVFANLFSNFFNFQISPDLAHQIIIAVFAAIFFIGAFGFMFKKSHSPAADAPKTASRNFGSLESSILLGSINILFFVFIILQFAHPTGVTYADYARKGFFQLNIVAVLSYLIVSFAEKRIIRQDEKHLRSFRLLSAALIAQVVLILVSAFTRLSLYEQAYGFTEIRLYSYGFMIWLGAVLILLLYHIWTSGKRSTFAFGVFCAVVLLLLGMNILNPDAFIAQKNLERYAATGKIDATYLGTLSYDALPYSIRLLDSSDPAAQKGFADAVYRRFNTCEGDQCVPPTKPYQTWQSWHLMDDEAVQTLWARFPTSAQ